MDGNCTLTPGEGYGLEIWQHLKDFYEGYMIQLDIGLTNILVGKQNTIQQMQPQ